MTTTIENLKNEISDYYIKDLKKQLGGFKQIAVLPIQKPIKDILLGKGELPEKFDEVKEFGRWKDIIPFIAPNIAYKIFEFIKSKRIEIETRKTENELIQLKNEILGLVPEDNDSKDNQGSEQKDNGGKDGVAEGDVDKGEGSGETTREATDNKDNQGSEQKDNGGNDGVIKGVGVAVVGGGLVLATEKLAARSAVDVGQLDAARMKSTIGEIIDITRRKRDALEHRLSTKELKILDNSIQKLETIIENVDTQAVDVLKEWNKLGNKLNISRSILEQCGLTADDLSTIGKNADLIFKYKGDINKVRSTLQEIGISSIDDSIAESFCRAGSAGEIKSMTYILRHGNKVSRMLQTLAGALAIDVAFTGVDIWMYIEQKKEAELISKLNKLRGENKNRQAKTQLGIGISSVVIEGIIIWMMYGSASGGAVGALIGFAVGVLTTVASMGVDSLYFDVVDFYEQNQEDFLRQSRSQLKQAILQGINNKKQGNESFNEVVTSFFSPSLKPCSEIKEKSLNDACVSMIILEEIGESGQFAYNNLLWDYIKSDKSKEDFLSDKDQNYKKTFDEIWEKLENRVNTRMQYVLKEFEKQDIIKSLSSGTGMQDLTDIFTNSRIFADLKESGKWDDSKSFEENLKSYKMELLSDFPDEKVQKFESIKQNNPSLFLEIITTVSLDGFIYGEEENGKDSDINYVQNVKMVAAYQKILGLTESIEDRRYLDINYVKNSKFIENLLRSDFDLTKVEYPTLNPETVVNAVNLNCERNGLTDISDDPLQNILYKLARELFGYSEKNEIRSLIGFFSESNADNHGVYYSSKWKINDDWVIDTELVNNIPQILHEKDVDNYVNEFINSNFYTPVYDEDGKVIGYSPKENIDTPTESIDDNLNTELITKITSIVREEMLNHTVENQEKIKNQISDFIKQHSNGKYIELPYFLILEAKKAGLGDLQRQYFKRENSRIETCCIPSELNQNLFDDCEKSFITSARESFTEEEQYYVVRVDNAYKKLESILNDDLGLPTDLHNIIVTKGKERKKFKEDVLLYDISVVNNQDTINRYKEYADYFENLYRGILMGISGFEMSNDISNINYFKMSMKYGNENLFDGEGNLLEGIEGDELGKQNEFRSFYNEQIVKLKIGGKTIKELWGSENEREKELAYRASKIIYTTVLEYALIDEEGVIHAGKTVTERMSTSSSMSYNMSRYYKFGNPGIIKDEDKVNKIIKTIEDKFESMRVLPELDGTKINNLMKRQTIQKLTNEENEVINTIPQEQERIEKTGEDINWKGRRGDIKYDPNKKVIQSRGKEVKVDLISENKIKLEGLDLDLTLQEGVWLSNFKNWVKYSYGDKEVEYTRGMLNRSLSFRNTFYIGDTMLITRGDLEKHCPICENDESTKRITEWLNL